MVLYHAFARAIPDDVSLSGLSPQFGLPFENFVVGWLLSKVAETQLLSSPGLADIRSLVSKKKIWSCPVAGLCAPINCSSKSGKCLQKTQRANSTRTGTVKTSLGS